MRRFPWAALLSAAGLIVVGAGWLLGWAGPASAAGPPPIAFLATVTGVTATVDGVRPALVSVRRAADPPITPTPIIPSLRPAVTASAVSPDLGPAVARVVAARPPDPRPDARGERLLAVVAAICVFGVTSAIIRAIVAQRTTRGLGPR